MLQFVLLSLLFGSPKALDPCVPMNMLPSVGQWDGTRFVRAAYRTFSISQDGYFWQDLSTFPTEDQNFGFFDFKTNGQVYLWSNLERCYVSRDLVHWTALDIPGGHILWNGAQWLVYGVEDVAVSADGYDWQVKTNAIGPVGTIVTYFKGRYMGSGAPIIASLDGLNWTNLSIDAYSLTVLGDKIVALRGSQIFISDDGDTWQEGQGAFEDAYFTSAAYNGQTYVATAPPYLYTSSDGLTWVQHDLPQGMDKVHAHNGRFLSTGVIYTSDDGIVWKSHGTYSSAYVALGDTLYFRSGYLKGNEFFLYLDNHTFRWVNGFYFTSGSLYRSTDGVGWQPLPVSAQLVYYHDGKDRWECFDDGTRYLSYDGVTWVSEAVPEMTYQVSLVHGRYFKPGMTSIDGFNWDQISDHPQNILWTGSYFIGLHNNHVLRSSNGITWHDLGTLGNGGLGLSILGDTLMASGFRTILVSLDQGHTWTRPLSNLGGITRAGVYRDHFVAFGDQNSLYSSSDGLLWQKRDLGLNVRRIFGDTPDRLFVEGDSTDYAIACLDGIMLEPTPVAVFPWVVANQTWYSRLGLMNGEGAAVTVRLEAEDRLGNTQSITRVISANGLLTGLASDFFPGLNGYSVTVFASLGTTYASLGGLSATLTTFNESPGAGTHSPAQAEACLVGELTEELLFAYLPGEDVPAVVLENMAPDAGEIQVTLSLTDDQGTILAVVDQTLTGRRPFASTVAELFPNITLPSSGAIRAKGPANAWLSGLTFDFNHLGQPSMDRASNLHPNKSTLLDD